MLSLQLLTFKVIIPEIHFEKVHPKELNEEENSKKGRKDPTNIGHHFKQVKIPTLNILSFGWTLNIEIRIDRVGIPKFGSTLEISQTDAFFFFDIRKRSQTRVSTDDILIDLCDIVIPDIFGKIHIVSEESVLKRILALRIGIWTQLVDDYRPTVIKGTRTITVKSHL